MTTLGAHGAGSGAGPLLEDRYRLKVPPPADRSAPMLADAFDQETQQWVTLLVLPDSSTMLERLALRSQVRRLADIEHPRLPKVLDVIDTRSSFAVVLPFCPDARLLADVGILPADGPDQLRSALQALHTTGRAHGGLDEGAVLVLPDSSVQLLPVPPDPAGTPAEDLRALAALASRHGRAIQHDVPPQHDVGPQQEVGTQHDVPPQREAPPPSASASRPSASSPGYAGATRLEPSAAPPRRRRWESGAPRAAVVAAGACVGALLADLISRLFT